MEKKTCQREECNNEFEVKSHNAIYCSDECRKIITNQRVLDKYYEKKEQKRINRTTKRICSTKTCITVLSSYNEESICELCKTQRLIDRLSSWGWDRDRLEEDWSY